MNYQRKDKKMLKEINKALALTRVANVPMNMLNDYLSFLCNCFMDGLSSFTNFSGKKVELSEEGISVDNFFFPFVGGGGAFEPRLTVEDGLGIIPVDGPIFNKSEGRIDQILGFASYEEMKMGYDKALSSDEVKAIAFKSDSPGGEAAGMIDFIDYVYSHRGEKPVFAIIDDNAYSAAYGVVSVADKIYGTQTSGMGSIGTVVKHVDHSQRDEMYGYKFTEIFAGDEKTLFSPHKPLSEKALQRFKEMVDSHYIDFVQSVARGRNLRNDDIMKMQARVYRGKEGLTVGLVDEIVPVDQAFSLIKSTIKKKEVNAKMDLNTLKDKHPELYQEVIQLGRTEAESGTETLRTENDSLKAENDSLKAENENLKKDITVKDAANQAYDERLKALEESKTTDKASQIWEKALAESDLRVEIQEKMAQVDPKAFVSKEGVFDEAGYKSAVDAEVKDWTDRVGSLSILGKGGGFRKETGDSLEDITDEDDAKAVEDLWKVSSPPKHEIDARTS